MTSIPNIDNDTMAFTLSCANSIVCRSLGALKFSVSHCGQCTFGSWDKSDCSAFMGTSTREQDNGLRYFFYDTPIYQQYPKQYRNHWHILHCSSTNCSKTNSHKKGHNRIMCVRCCLSYQSTGIAFPTLSHQNHSNRAHSTSCSANGLTASSQFLT